MSFRLALLVFYIFERPYPHSLLCSDSATEHPILSAFGWDKLAEIYPGTVEGYAKLPALATLQSLRNIALSHFGLGGQMNWAHQSQNRSRVYFLSSVKKAERRVWKEC